MKSTAIGVVVIGGVIMATVGGYGLGTIGASSFNYETASMENRKKFLQSQAESFGKVIKLGLISPSGVGPSMKLGETIINDRTKRITYIILIDGRIASGQRLRKAKKLFLEKACPRYMKTRLAENRISLVQEFRNKKKKNRMGRITLSTHACSRYA